MKNQPRLALPTRWRELTSDAQGYRHWQLRTADRLLDPARTALVLCDVWDRHWCRGAMERLALLLPQLDATARCARDRGMLVIHAPSGTIGAYAGHPARVRAQRAPAVTMPAERAVDDPAHPIDGSQSSDTDADPATENTRCWTCQHPDLWIDRDRDAISDDGAEHLALYAERGIELVLLAGVHANMCVLNRSFAIKQLVRWGVAVLLLRDLTDAMYNPARPPYVSHAAGTELAVQYIEQFWCPSARGAALRQAGPRRQR